MKKVFTLIIAVAFVCSTAAPALALDMPRPVDKLVKGVVEIVKSPLAIYDHTRAEMDGADHVLVGFVKGLVMSPFHFIQRAGNGVIDVATFPIE